ncbi:hypothetical protein HK405_013630, partial [Cladochytrium tenue]
GRQDAEVLPLSDPEGLFVGYAKRSELDASLLLPDETAAAAASNDDSAMIPVACIGAFKYSEERGFIGFYIVRNAALRGRGYGLQLFRAAMDYLGPACNAGLDGVVAQQHNYAKSGFAPAWDSWRWTLPPRGAVSSALAPSPPPGTAAAVSVGDEDLARLMLQYSGLPRPAAFVRAWLAHSDILTVGLRSETGGDLVAVGSVRPAASGYRVGPVFAPGAAEAAWVVRMLVAGVPADAAVVADVVMANGTAPDVFRAAGFSDRDAFVCARMWTKGSPVTPAAVAGVFAVTTLELAGAALLHLATGLHLVLPHLYTALSDAAVLRSRIPSPQRADALAAQRALLTSLFPGGSGGSLLSFSWPAGLLTAAYALLLLATAATAATAQGVTRRATAVAALVLAVVPVAAAYARGLVLASSAASPALRLALPASSRAGRLTAADEARALVDLALLAAVAAAAFAAAA